MAIPYGRIKPLHLQHIENLNLREAVFRLQESQKPVEFPAVMQVSSETEALKVERERVRQQGSDLLRLALYHVCQLDGDPEKHKYPCRLKQEERQYIEAEGKYWYHLLKLCESLHSHQNYGYANAANWFWALVQEWCEAKEQSIAKGEVTGGRNAFSSFVATDLKNLKQGLNSPCADLPHRKRLFNTALNRLGGKKCHFRKNYWNTFLGAYRAWKKEVDTNKCLVSLYEKEDRYWKHVCQPGQKGMVRLTRWSYR